jgi:hypothetical protein
MRAARQRHAGGAATACGRRGNGVTTAILPGSKVPMAGRILTFCGFLDFLAWRVTSEQLSEVTREDHDFSKSQELFRAFAVHMSQK